MKYSFNQERKWGGTVVKRLFVLHRTVSDLADAVNRTPNHICAVLSGGRPSKKMRDEIEKVLRQWEEQAEQRYQEYKKSK